jgi:hypothetical protein
MALRKLVDAQFRTQWEVFNKQDEYKTGFLVNVGVAIFSTDMVGCILNFKSWSGTRYLDDQGMTEAEAYSELIAEYRDKQRIVRNQLPISALPQTVYDALVSLYVDTGTWRIVKADEGTYDLQDAIRNSNWLLAADILMRGNVNPDLRKVEAKVLYLGQYQFGKDRQQLVTEGIHDIRRRYVSGTLDPVARKQAEFVYYRQLGAFLPTMPEVKQRRVIAQADIRSRQTQPSFVRFTNDIFPELGFLPKADNYDNDPE